MNSKDERHTPVTSHVVLSGACPRSSPTRCGLVFSQRLNVRTTNDKKPKERRFFPLCADSARSSKYPHAVVTSETRLRGSREVYIWDLPEGMLACVSLIDSARAAFNCDSLFPYRLLLLQPALSSADTSAHLGEAGVRSPRGVCIVRRSVLDCQKALPRPSVIKKKKGRKKPVE